LPAAARVFDLDGCCSGVFNFGDGSAALRNTCPPAAPSNEDHRHDCGDDCERSPGDAKEYSDATDGVALSCRMQAWGRLAWHF
jgi:hypothetical protein